MFLKLLFVLYSSFSNLLCILEKPDFTDTFGPGPYPDLMTESDCIMFDPEKVDSSAMFKSRPACKAGKGICKYKLGKKYFK